jgi:hypothetical protein
MAITFQSRILVVWFMNSCIVGCYRRFTGTCFLHFRFRPEAWMACSSEVLVSMYSTWYRNLKDHTFNIYQPFRWSRNSVVGRLRGSNPGRCKIFCFPKRPDQLWRLPSLLCNRTLSPGLNQLGREANHWPPSSAELVSGDTRTLPLYSFMACTETALPFVIFINTVYTLSIARVRLFPSYLPAIA